MKISDFDIYHLPPLMGSFVDFIEDKCRKLLEESPQFTELMREDHELLDKYWFLNTITDTNGVTNALNLSYEETKALQRFCTVEEDINCWQRLQMYLLGMEHLDNDRTGRLATKAIQTVAPEKYHVKDQPPAKGKDCNDMLCLRLNLGLTRREKSKNQKSSRLWER